MMKWNDPVSEVPDTTINGTIDLGYGVNFAIYNQADDTPRFGAVVTKITESRIVLRTGAGKEIFNGSLMELAFLRLRSVGLGAGGES
jgi:hypothetical protein